MATGQFFISEFGKSSKNLEVCSENVFQLSEFKIPKTDQEELKGPFYLLIAD